MANLVKLEKLYLTDSPMDISLDISVQRSLDRLLLSNRVRELVGYPKPVSVVELSGSRGLVSRVFKLVNGSRGQSTLKSGGKRRGLIDGSAVVALRLLLYRWRMRRAASLETIKVAYRRMRRPKADPLEMLDYIILGAREEALVRTCLSFRALGRYGGCVELLLERLKSGLPAEETRYWLSYLLKEIGDREAADKIHPSMNDQRDAYTLDTVHLSTVGSSTDTGPPRLKYAVVMPVVFDSDTFRSSLLSILGSDFQGQVVVVEEGHIPERVCEAFCQSLPVTYVKNPRWLGPTACANLGLEQLEPEIDIAIYAHSDLLWPSRWFRQLNDAWERVYSTGKVSVINLGIVQFAGQNDPILRDLFVRGRYDDLIWLLRLMQDARSLAERVQDFQVRDVGRTFGFVRNLSADIAPKLGETRMIESPGVSFLVEAWRELGGLNPGTSSCIDLELLHHAFKSRKWSVWMNNVPLIHMAGTDTKDLSEDQKVRHRQNEADIYANFPKKYGCSADHFLNTYIAETAFVHRDVVVDAINDLRFSDVDFVFDELEQRLQSNRLVDRELVRPRV